LFRTILDQLCDYLCSRHTDHYGATTSTSTSASYSTATETSSSTGTAETAGTLIVEAWTLGFLHYKGRFPVPLFYRNPPRRRLLELALY
jgi:hypothetical protein